jgi:hypothetical protein
VFLPHLAFFQKGQLMTEISVRQIGRFRAEEALAAIQAHGDPSEHVVGVIVAQALFMLGAVIVNLQSEEDKTEQRRIYLERIDDVIEELEYERREPDDNSDSNEDSE